MNVARVVDSWWTTRRQGDRPVPRDGARRDAAGRRGTAGLAADKPIVATRSVSAKPRPVPPRRIPDRWSATTGSSKRSAASSASYGSPRSRTWLLHRGAAGALGACARPAAGSRLDLLAAYCEMAADQAEAAGVAVPRWREDAGRAGGRSCRPSARPTTRWTSPAGQCWTLRCLPAACPPSAPIPPSAWSPVSWTCRNSEPGDPGYRGGIVRQIGAGFPHRPVPRSCSACCRGR